MAVQKVAEFDVWREGYNGATVEIYRAGTTTRLSVYTDLALSEEADNPQTLQSLTINGRYFGKFDQPLYVNEDYELLINGTEQTGVVKLGITTMENVEIDYATLKSARGTVHSRMIDILDRVVHAEDFGELGGSSATNTTTLNAAIGAVSGQGGGDVLIPYGTYAFTTLTLPQNVRLRGVHMAGTILQSQTADTVLTLGGDGAGLCDLTLDGVSLVVGSIGVKSIGNDKTCFRNVTVKRFAVGIRYYGGRYADWQNFHLSANDVGADLRGDTDPSDTGSGDEFAQNLWQGGSVQLNVSYGVKLNYENEYCRANAFQDVLFKDNTGPALYCNGPRYTRLLDCSFIDNITDIQTLDDTDTSLVLENTVIGLHMIGGRIKGGAMTIAGTCQDVCFERVRIEDVDWTLSQTNTITLKDCTEDDQCTVAGQTLKLGRWFTQEGAQVAGRTTDATVTVAWSRTLQPGEFIECWGIAIGNQRNGTNKACYKKLYRAHRPGSTLAYDGQTANFTVGEVITGSISGATALVIADTDAGATGTLTLRDISGTFVDNETLTGSSTGIAVANGTLSHSGAAIRGTEATIGTDFEDIAGWTAAFGVSGNEVQFSVTGAASTTIDWTVKVEVFHP